jgi:hypothetical protein
MIVSGTISMIRAIEPLRLCCCRANTDGRLNSSPSGDGQPRHTMTKQRRKRRNCGRRDEWSEDTRGRGLWRSFGYDELIKRDKVNLDIFWLKDTSLEDSDDLPAPDVLAQEIADDLQTALEQFQAIAEKVKG